MGDAALTANEALYNFDLIKFYHNFLNLLVDDQLANGELPNYVPVGNGPSDAGWGDNYPPDPNWGTALPTITWQVYRHYNDVETLKKYYDQNVAYVDYLRGVYNSTGLVNFTERYSDWVPPPPAPGTNRKLVAAYGFLHDVNLMINMSQILGKTSDTDMYSKFYKQLSEEFHQLFYNTSLNCYADGLQAAQVLALSLPNLVPANVRNSVIDHLVNDILKQDTHVTTGIISTAQIYPILSDNGHHDLALELVSSITYPSYGYMFNNPFENATTILERWNTPTADPGMNSRNQAMFSSVGAWFYSHLAGIDFLPDTILIRPRMTSESKKHLMPKLNCQLSTLYGLVRISYTRENLPNTIQLRVTVPPNARARLMFEPLFAGGQCQTLTESNRIIWSANSTNEWKVEKDPTNNLMTVHLGSGEYEFQAIWQ